MKFLEKFKSKRFKKVSKYVAGLVASAALISLAIFPALSMQADGPRFNFLQNDYELMQGLNKTQNEQNWKDPVAASAGDVVAVNIYYHNGMVDTTAINTRIKATIPASTTNKVAHMTASISADNAATVTDTVINGQVNGPSGLTVNFNEDANLALVPGSVEWRPSAGPNNNQIFPLPFGQSGNEITSANGINIGDIQGCWDFAGFVSFLVRSTPKEIPADIEVVKTVRNISDGQTAFVDSTNADQSERVEFKVNVRNSGEANLSNVMVRDSLPNELLPVINSGKLLKDGVETTISLGDFLASGANIGSLLSGSSAVVTFRATAPNVIPSAKTVVNTATATSGTLHDSDTASVVLNPGVVTIEKAKSAFNETQGINAESRPANAGDVIKYTLTTRNTGNMPTQVVVSDDISDILEYANVTEISDSGTVVAGTIVYPSVTIAPGAEVANWFVVKVKNPLPTNPQDGYHFDKVMFNEYGNSVIIHINVPVLTPSLSIEKLVRNITKNELEFVNSNVALPGDALEYKIIFRNTGAGAADRVKISDVLPANVSLDTTVPAIINLNGQERSITENVVSGFIITTLSPGQEGYVRFRAIISSGIAANERLVNKGVLEHAGNVLTDTAETLILQKVTTVATPSTPVQIPRTGGSNEVVSLLATLFTGVGSIAVIRKIKK